MITLKQRFNDLLQHQMRRNITVAERENFFRFYMVGANEFALRMQGGSVDDALTEVRSWGIAAKETDKAEIQFRRDYNEHKRGPA